MSIEMKNDRKERGHPCGGCPYVFTMGGTDCIMAAVPGDCAWYFYKRLMGHGDALAPAGEIRKRYGEYARAASGAGEKLECGIRMLLEVAEFKYGKTYAHRLKKKMKGKGEDEIKRFDPCHK
ncbi:MAG: hypothetical protein NC305_06310 [Lachnospiraceae bacterium]|nr:hypothetical protein [Lachnospiraceae bacterium]